MNEAPLVLGFAGDILIDRDEPAAVFAEVADVLAAVDVLFGNCEAVYTTQPHPAPSAGAVMISHPRNAEALSVFDVMSLANNHIVDAGHAAMLETAELVRGAGALPVGVGRDLQAARTAAIVESRGRRVAYLAYASVFPYGYEARRDWPGLAPVRAHNHHVERLPNYWVPGVIGHVVSTPHKEDYANLAEDLNRARNDADVVVASFHWGDYQQPFTLTDHERTTARFAVDHGADVVVGHHHHTLRGIEWYDGRPIFYGLGHFVFDDRNDFPLYWMEDATVGLGEADMYEIYPRPGWPLLHMHPDARMTMVGWVHVDAMNQPTCAGFLPCSLTPDGIVHPHRPESPNGQKVLEYMRLACTSQQLAVELTEGGHELGGLPTIKVTARASS